jgi:hypothetical protein
VATVTQQAGQQQTAQQQAPTPAATPRRSGPGEQLWYLWYAYPAVRVAAVLLSLAILGLVVWLLLLRPDDQPSGVAQPGAGPVETSEADLATLSNEVGLPIYWAGALPDTRLEATLTSNKYAYVRYLTADAPVGDASPEYLTVASYPSVNALDNLRSYARSEGASTQRIPGGGVAVPVPGSPTSVYFARPIADVQVEVFDPQPGEALQLIRSGAIAPVPGGVPPAQKGTPDLTPTPTG